MVASSAGLGDGCDGASEGGGTRADGALDGAGGLRGRGGEDSSEHCDGSVVIYSALLGLDMIEGRSGVKCGWFVGGEVDERSMFTI